jgi:hypothetical protein
MVRRRSETGHAGPTLCVDDATETLFAAWFVPEESREQ